MLDPRWIRRAPEEVKERLAARGASEETDAAVDRVLGVADAPALRARYHACRGEGAWRDGDRLHVSEVDELAASFMVHSGIEEWIGGRRDDRLRDVAS